MERDSRSQLAELSRYRDEALRFPTAELVLEAWRTVRERDGGVRPDGQPDRPLTALTIEVVEVDE